MLMSIALAVIGIDDHIRYADGNVYEGEFREDRVEGKGKLTINPGTLLQEVRH
jgi:hypothetical protein